jgi:ketosteroid isomerase-like protein
LLVVLESLTPLERAVFVLKEAFDFSYAEIAEAVERSEDTVRQAAHRARGHVRARRPRFAELAERTTEHCHADRARQREVTERFFTATTGGDINTLMQLLAPDVTLWTDGGGKVRQATRPVTGAERVAKWFVGVGSRPYEGVAPAEMRAEVVDLNGSPGIVFSGAGRVIATLTLDLDEHGRIVALHNVANPDKLHAVATRTVHEIGPMS